jgi:uncharacterized protein YbjT (DUF2867 family)
LARVLIVGCGCRGRELGHALAETGHSVRGTARSADTLTTIEAAGVEGAVADPDRLGTLLPAIEGISVVCWLLGSATGDTLEAVHGPRLETLLERLVDTPVRGFVYEAGGSAPAELLAAGSALVRGAGERWRIPVEVVEQDPAGHLGWLTAMRAAVARTLD